ncbi:uncharacterized protein N7511_001970 [Penicillium nucicola]|uniref:uncharacterized protein n=1 Tax=Penicillium nucicola TaxID=1850975 RepID=UPI0025451B6E|nr:uncharacterized protein N7511_001970 [Penicillium nucicola]KAJ5769919.1 hypothetical protein N7511_001970 [Penicillium nucicola]
MPQDLHPWEEKGKTLQNWLEGSGETKCPYPKSTLDLTWRSHQQDFLVKQKPKPLKLALRNALEISEPYSTFQSIEINQRNEGPAIWWIGRVGQGMIIVDEMFRSTRSEDPFMSELTKAAYQRAFSLDTLKSVVVAEINQRDTLQAVNHVYKSQRLSNPSDVQHTWYPSSPEYQILLGTGVGRVVAAFVLCAYGQRAKKIVSIVTFFMSSDVHKLYIRFEVDEI